MHSTCTGTGTSRLGTGTGTGDWRLGTGTCTDTWTTGTGTGTGTCLLSTWYKAEAVVFCIFRILRVFLCFMCLYIFNCIFLFWLAMGHVLDTTKWWW